MRSCRARSLIASVLLKNCQRRERTRCPLRAAAGLGPRAALHDDARAAQRPRGDSHFKHQASIPNQSEHNSLMSVLCVH